MNKVQYLKLMILSGVNNLHNYYPHIDKLNVFPVPDGDTGTNMNLTATNGYKAIENENFKSIGEELSAFARGLIMGARGNSGVIFSQIVKGFSKGMADAKDLSVQEWKKGFTEASNVAYTAVMNPVEGTILTVIRETAEGANKIPDNTDIKKFWTQVVKEANKSLDNTPNLLKQLKDVGVVDSGGYGLVKFLEGMNQYVQKGRPVQQKLKLEENNGGNLEMDLGGEPEFGYCTEAIVDLAKPFINNLKVSTIRDQLEKFNNKSMVVVIDDDILKVHTHALNPGEVLTYLQEFGDFRTLKIENMNLQADRQVKGWKESSDVKQERKLALPLATIAVVQSPEQKDYFEKELGVDIAIDGGGKMNPSTTDFIEAIAQVDAKTVYVMPNNSNVILTANQAAEEEKQSKIVVIPTKTIPQGVTAALSIDPDGTVATNTKNVTKALKNVVSFSIAQAAKDSLSDGVTIKNGQQMAIVDNKIVAAEDSVKDVFSKDLAKHINKDVEILTIFTGEDAKESDIDELKKFLDDNFSVEYEIVDGGQKVYSFIIGIE
ncbi:DAK2 domain-containing protein [Mesoplasma lactucae]|uniref:Dihydroxyacetone kinase n=1 Tax=Mesoplasma lactucae ATCC 49193 TaxID=81460 RepID=A0A291IRQ1_9MOLU|nr:DAK2 domain-containing protein [Mesoplasma lactucae]ATG97532.1 dihydroxyacetone kinase [Mesoplasma lactucae ATCC 49193]ATZ20010.1 dihydroxyacetone/glyceraldehyde kinase [Mesoplasma lactucae ATCC 49193]MCL8217039.1 hypothetical protein [Mesoplasma lactucae ATCC 49193]